MRTDNHDVVESGMAIPAVHPMEAHPERDLVAQFQRAREQTVHLCAPLQTEDYVVSSMADVSPTKWHLAHTSWFFETFVLADHDAEYRSPNPRYAFLFNSYYVQAGERHCRAQRGLVTRPSVAEVMEYRRHVDAAVSRLCDRITDQPEHPARALIELGIHHEQQHQELLLTDIKHVFWTNPLKPAYRDALPTTRQADAMEWKSFDAGIRTRARDLPSTTRGPHTGCLPKHSASPTAS
jgi:hypothetical protein